MQSKRRLELISPGESVGRVVCITAVINIMSLYLPPQYNILSIFTCVENKGGKSRCEWAEGRGVVKPELSALSKFSITLISKGR